VSAVVPLSVSHESSLAGAAVTRQLSRARLYVSARRLRLVLVGLSGFRRVVRIATEELAQV
jgi:hypothetical protein